MEERNEMPWYFFWGLHGEIKRLKEDPEWMKGYTAWLEDWRKTHPAPAVEKA